MRVELPNKSPGQPASGVASPVAPDAVEPSAVAPSPRRASARERWLRAVTQWRVALPVLALSAVVLGWEWIARAPVARKPLVVQARETFGSPTNPPVTAELLAALKADQARSLASLVRSRKDIPPILAGLEQQARALGWDCERAMKPPVSAPFGLTNLTLHPVVMHLAIGDSQSVPPFTRLAAWLRAAASLPVRAEIVEVDLRADGAGLNAAEVKMQFFSANTHEEASSK